MAARDAYDRHESGSQARAVAWQRRAGAIRRRPRSEYAEALAVAEAMVAARIEGMIVEGAVVFTGVVRQQRASGHSAGPEPPVESRRVGGVTRAPLGFSIAASVDGFKKQAQSYEDAIAADTYMRLAAINPAERMEPRHAAHDDGSRHPLAVALEKTLQAFSFRKKGDEGG